MSRMPRRSRLQGIARPALVAALLLAALATSTDRSCGEQASDPPDLTVTRDVDRERTYNLGATGLRGWIFTRPDDFLESQQGRTTTRSRQILVTHVGTGSPADGVIDVDDVILGIGSEPFTDDARRGLALAIQAAEADDGRLRLLRWRDGQTSTVEIPLEVLGRYASSAPADCTKSARVLDGACRALERTPLRDDLWGAVDGLALLATGRADYLPRIREHARRMGPADLSLPLEDGMVIWDWGYRALYLCEYHLLTGDEAVLPAIREYTTALAKGQSLYGTFGHGISRRTKSGDLHGSIPPYGPVNAAGLIGNLAIAMGRRCGVDHPEVGPAIERAARFFGSYVDQGAIPYGEHIAWANHDNNGKNAMAAVLFATIGDRPVETRYFAKMVTASYRNREYGHTGQGFSYLWGAPGAHVGGGEALATFFRHASWHFDLMRRCDGSFTYDGGEQYGPGRTDDDTYFGPSSYYGLSPDACAILTYALPLKTLVITGRDAAPAHALSADDVAAAEASGRLDLDRKEMSDDELIDRLGDWSPVARGWAAEELGRRPSRDTVVKTLINLAEGPDLHRAQGAAEALGHARSAAALPVLVRLLTAEDRWLRIKAAQALRQMGDLAKPVVPAMLRVIAETSVPTLPVRWDDPIQLAQGELAATVFQGSLQNVAHDADSALLHAAIRAVAQNPDGMARATLTRTIGEALSLDDIRALGPDLLEAIATPSPADTMFANEIRMASLKALARHRFREGIDAGLEFARTQSAHGSEHRTGEILALLLSYGRAAQPTLPALRALVGQFQAEDFPDWAKRQKIESLEKAIAILEAETDEPALRSFSE